MAKPRKDNFPIILEPNYLSIIPTTGIYTRVGDAGTTTHTLNTNDDLLVSGRLEVDGATYLDGTLTVGGVGSFPYAVTFSSGAYFANDIGIGMSDVSGLIIIPRQTAQTPDAGVIGTGSLSNSVIFCEGADRLNDFAHALQTNPTLYIQSGDANQDMMYGSLAHDQTNFTIRTGYSAVSIGFDASKAQGTMTMSGLPVAEETFVVNATTFTAKASGATGDQFNIGADASTTLGNIVTMFNAGSELANCKAWKASASTVNFEWKTGGVAGNSIVFTEAMTNTTVNGSGTLGTTKAGYAATTPFVFNSNGRLDSTGLYYCGSNQPYAGVNGATAYGAFYPQSTYQTPDTALLTTGTVANSLIICENADQSYDFAHALQTNPTLFIQSASQSTTQWGSFAHDQTDFTITAGAGKINLASMSKLKTSATLTASTTQTQAGGTAIVSDITNVSTCANANDAVTLPLAVGGQVLWIFNNGAATLQIFPGVSDNLGAGVDTSKTLAAGKQACFISYDATNWQPVLGVNLL